jgi:phage/plasmid-associated DNA primase
LYIYIISWISYLIQNPGSKTETVLIIFGEQGTCKNKFFTDVISKLFGRYCISNENNISNIIGRFNSIIENKILIICNELQSIDNAKHLNTDGLKSLITDNEINIESKYINTRKIQNISNFIFTSNNLLPINIESSDRRYVVFKTSNSYKNNFKYLNNLNNVFNINTGTFYNNLLSFFKNYDISNYNPRIISITKMKIQMIDACNESWQLFFEDKLFRFKDKYNSSTAYSDYCNYCENEKYQPFGKKMFGLKILTLVDEKTTTKDKKIFRYFKIKDSVMSKYNIGNDNNFKRNIFFPNG